MFLFSGTEDDRNNAREVSKDKLLNLIHLNPHKNTLAVERFDFDKRLFHVDKTKPWNNPNLIKLCREAVRQVIAEQKNINRSNADQLIVYPRGGVLYERWEEGDLDLTFYLNDWVYEAYGGDLPYAAIVDRFISLAGASGLNIVEEGYNPDSVAKPSQKNDRFNQFPVHILNNSGNAVRIHIIDGPLSFINPNLMLEIGGIGFVYDPDGNYYGSKDALDIFNRYVAEIDIESLILVKLKNFVLATQDLVDWIESIQRAYSKMSRIEYGVYLSKFYRKPFVRAITLWRLVGDEQKMRDTIKKLNSIEQQIHSGKYHDPYQRLDMLKPYYEELQQAFIDKTHKQHLIRAEEAIRQRIGPRIVRG